MVKKVVLTGNEKAVLTWREGNAIHFEYFTYSQLPQKIADIATHKTPSFDSDGVKITGDFGEETELWIGDPEIDYICYRSFDLLKIVTMAFIADVLFKQGKTPQQISQYLDTHEQS